MVIENNINVINLDNIKIKEQLTRYGEEGVEENVKVSQYLPSVKRYCRKLVET